MHFVSLLSHVNPEQLLFVPMNYTQGNHSCYLSYDPHLILEHTGFYGNKLQGSVQAAILTFSPSEPVSVFMQNSRYYIHKSINQSIKENIED